MSLFAKPIKIIIVDDHKILLDGLQSVLNRIRSIQVVAAVDNGMKALEIVEQQEIDVVLMDIEMPQIDGFQTANQMLNRFPGTKILILSMHNDRPYIERMYNLGVCGYLLKTANIDDIIDAIHKVHNGELYFSADIIKNMIIKKEDSSSYVKLTRRERQVIELIAKEMNNTEIAELLSLSVETINTYRKNLLKKLGVKNTAGLVKYAISEGLTKP